MNQFDKYVQEYLDVLKYQKNYSSLTIDGYKREIEHFIVYLNKENICDFKDVRYPFLRGYLAQLHSENLSPKDSIVIYKLRDISMTIHFF